MCQLNTKLWNVKWGAYRSIETVAVVVQQTLFLQEVELDPVVETRHLPTLYLSCSDKDTLTYVLIHTCMHTCIHTHTPTHTHTYANQYKTIKQTCKDVLKST